MRALDFDCLDMGLVAACRRMLRRVRRPARVNYLLMPTVARFSLSAR